MVAKLLTHERIFKLLWVIPFVTLFALYLIFAMSKPKQITLIKVHEDQLVTIGNYLLENYITIEAVHKTNLEHLKNRFQQLRLHLHSINPFQIESNDYYVVIAENYLTNEVFGDQYDIYLEENPPKSMEELRFEFHKSYEIKVGKMIKDSNRNIIEAHVNVNNSDENPSANIKITSLNEVSTKELNEIRDLIAVLHENLDKKNIWIDTQIQKVISQNDIY